MMTECMRGCIRYCLNKNSTLLYLTAAAALNGMEKRCQGTRFYDRLIKLGKHPLSVIPGIVSMS